MLSAPLLTNVSPRHIKCFFIQMLISEKNCFYHEKKYKTVKINFTKFADIYVRGSLAPTLNAPQFFFGRQLI